MEDRGLGCLGSMLVVAISVLLSLIVVGLITGMSTLTLP